MKNIDLYYMQQALVLAKRGRLTVSPNPMVGCMIVKDGLIVGEGWHQKAGESHAEIYALRDAGEKAKQATVYVTLEPCCHSGRTGPCTDALIAAGVKKVVIATLDPNPKVVGNGAAKLRQAGIEVDVGVLQKQAQDLNKIFFHFQKNKRPYVFAKWAMSLDGKTQVNQQDSKQISSYKAKEYTHELRSICDAIVVGKNTLVDDNPKLDVRIGNKDRVNPVRFVVFSKLDKLDHSWNILDQKFAKTVFVCTDVKGGIEQELAELGIEIYKVQSYRGRVCIDSLLQKMASDGITSLLVEGGRALLNDFVDRSFVDEFITYISPVLIADVEIKRELEFSQIGSLDNDVLVKSKFKEGKNV